MFSEESFTMKHTDNIMPGKAAGMLKVCNSKWSAKLEIGSEINGMGIQCDQMQNAALKQR